MPLSERERIARMRLDVDIHGVDAHCLILAASLGTIRALKRNLLRHLDPLNLPLRGDYLAVLDQTTGLLPPILVKAWIAAQLAGDTTR
jgi:hypothetical protein